MAKSLSPTAVWGIVRELRGAASDTGPLQIGGPLAPQLEKELAVGATPGAVRVGGRLEDAECLIRVLAGAPTPEDEEELKAAKRAKVPVVVVQTGTEEFDVPYVLATDVVMCRPGPASPSRRSQRPSPLGSASPERASPRACRRSAGRSAGT